MNPVFKSSQTLYGRTDAITGDSSKLSGVISPDLRGNVSQLSGEINAGLFGDATGVKGDVTGLYGDLTGITGDLSKAGITAGERAAGVNLKRLIIK
jgi:hypothetical protein